MPAKTFTKIVNILRRDDSGVPLTGTGKSDGKPLVERELGSFVFRVPTFAQQKDVRVRMDRDFSQISDVGRMNIDTFYSIMVCAHFPYLIENAPEGFEWDSISDEEARAVYDTYVEGKNEVTGEKNS